MDDIKARKLRNLIVSAEKSVISAKKLLKELMDEEGIEISNAPISTKWLKVSDDVVEWKFIEWVFTWEEMLWADGIKYPVPGNYASKSKLVQGDKLKLIITESGQMKFKQIEQIERETKVWLLTKDGTKYQAVVDWEVYNLITASVTHYKSNIWDVVTVIVPKWKEATFAAVEAIVPAE